MRFSRHATKLVLLLVAFAAAASALVLPNSANDIHNSDRGAKLVRRQGQRWTWEDLWNGRVRHDPRHPQMIRPDGYFSSIYFHDGKPLFIYDVNSPRGVYKLDAKHALANYGGFHAYEINSEKVVTVTPDGTFQNDANVAKVGKGANWVKTQFGETPSLLAFGSNVHPLPRPRARFLRGRPQQVAPTWDEVMTKGVANPGDRLEFLKPILADQRHMRFVNEFGTVNLNIRAHPDGSVEHQLWDLIKNEEIHLRL
ncbi:uncharacterized protein UDID_17952 [Ustilago sp. UG-2017a]|nr:uncharacterized protein UDID_17952 [Ustilago sp. UG-2017a]